MEACGVHLEVFGFQVGTNRSSVSKEMANISVHNGFCFGGGTWRFVGGDWRVVLLNEAATLTNYSLLANKK